MSFMTLFFISFANCVEFKPRSSKSKIPVVVGTSVGAFVVCLIFLILWWREAALVARHQGKKVLLIKLL